MKGILPPRARHKKSGLCKTILKPSEKLILFNGFIIDNNSLTFYIDLAEVNGCNKRKNIIESKADCDGLRVINACIFNPVFNSLWLTIKITFFWSTGICRLMYS